MFVNFLLKLISISFVESYWFIYYNPVFTRDTLVYNDLIQLFTVCILKSKPVETLVITCTRT